jgi:hypothetical protein
MSDNTMFVGVSIILSIGATLFLWRAAYWLLGERVALITAMLWVTSPLFWFYGEVATVYIHEAFFASAILWLGITLLRRPQDAWRAVLLAVTLAIATGSRQSSFLFFAPAVLYLFVATKQKGKIWILSMLVFLVVTSAWIVVLLNQSGGFSTYLHFASLEHIYRSQSVLFGNPLRVHLTVIGKVTIYLLISSFTPLLIILFALVQFPHETWKFVKEALGTRVMRATALVALIPLLFYVLVYFMKAGYLLNVLPSITLCAAVLLDRCAIWLAKAAKEKPGNGSRLTRPLITRNAIVLTSIAVIINTIWFFAPLPGKSADAFHDAQSQDSFSQDLASRFANPQQKRDDLLNKLFAYGSVQSVRTVDLLNDTITTTLERIAQSGRPQVLLATWWSRLAYYYAPEIDVYDLRQEPNSRLIVGKARDRFRTMVVDTIIHFPRRAQVTLLIRRDHPQLGELRKHLHLSALPMPKYLDLYEITDSTFSFTWGGVRFVKD